MNMKKAKSLKNKSFEQLHDAELHLNAFDHLLKLSTVPTSTHF